MCKLYSSTPYHSQTSLLTPDRRPPHQLPYHPIHLRLHVHKLCRNQGLQRMHNQRSPQSLARCHLPFNNPSLSIIPPVLQSLYYRSSQPPITPALDRSAEPRAYVTRVRGHRPPQSVAVATVPSLFGLGVVNVVGVC